MWGQLLTKGSFFSLETLTLFLEGFRHRENQTGSHNSLCKRYENGGKQAGVPTLKCLSIGTPKAINFPFVSNEKLKFLGVPVFKHIVMRL